MKWTTKARVQAILARLPRSIREDAYYLIQRRFGAYRRHDPSEHLTAAVRFLSLARANRLEKRFDTIVEVGTGRSLTLPLTFWLAGASRILTVDVNRYLKADVVADAVTYISRTRSAALGVLGP